MTVLLILAFVAVVTAAALIWLDIRREKRAAAVPSKSDVVRRVEAATQPPVVQEPTMAPVSSLPARVEDRRPARKPRATKQTVLDELKRSGPSTSRDLAAKFTGASPTIVAGLLVRLRGEGKVASQQRRNLQVWEAS